ncbi:MAG TPA: hypothetical protein VLV83_19940 [Acidobacteriota bacterium]|nr:hypothetical protein [Acidobacteriota bacterium]
MSSKVTERLARWAKEIDYGLVLPALGRLPRPLAHRLSDLRGSLSSRLKGGSWRTCIENAALAFPERSREELGHIIRQAARTLSRDEMESYWFGHRLDWFEPMMEVEGLQDLEAAISSKKGVLFFTGHFGSTGTVIAYLAKRGFPINLIFRHTDEVEGMPRPWYRYAKKRVRLLEQACRRPVLYTGKSHYFGMRRALRKGEIAIMGLDVMPSLVGRTVEIDLLGRKALLPDGAARLFRDTGARAVFWFNHWKKGVHRVTIQDRTPSLDGITDLPALTQELFRPVEEMITRHPEEWLMWEAFDQFLVEDGTINEHEKVGRWPDSRQ